MRTKRSSRDMTIDPAGKRTPRSHSVQRVHNARSRKSVMPAAQGRLIFL